MYLDYLTIGLCTLLALSIWWYRKVSRLPPGPPATLIGNAHHNPTAENWKTLKKFADQYGPMICLWKFGSETIILNDYATANALLNHRSNIYSSRPTLWMSGRLAGRSDTVFQTKSTSPRFKTYRALLYKTLNQRAIQTYRPLQDTECQILLKGLLETPDDFIAHSRRNAVALIMRVAYGYQVETIDDKFVGILEEAFRLNRDLNTPNLYWVEFLPILRHVPTWVPGAGFKRLALRMARELRRLDTVPFNWATSQVSTGSYEESFVSDHIHDKGFAPTEEEREDILRWCAAALYIGGGDTTVSVMTTFFFLMACHPNVQWRAREEIDSVLGGNWVTHDVRLFLPYVNAMIKEIIRWGPVVPLCLPHQTIEDDGFNGYFIPKDTIVVANIWAMAYDENVYPNPTKFDPTRFLGENQQMDPLKYVFGFGRRICPGIPHAVTKDDHYDGYFIPKGTRIIANIYAMTRDKSIYPNPDVFDPTRFFGENPQMDPYKFVFGFGRRICPGLHLAESSLYLNIINILANFTISKKFGEDGKEIEPEVYWQTGITAHLKPFPCQVTPRSA
ncbi:O-methylsterigmatocystin oxidoreductase [Leucoagaricus sp. SymC.cos]|nr:O-methylsterigmatocystin oxidoreductase [Leucoagaricus sp. SymC.cos]